MRLAVSLLLMLPLVVYLDVVGLGGPALSFAAIVVVLGLFWAGIRTERKIMRLALALLLMLPLVVYLEVIHLGGPTFSLAAVVALLGLLAWAGIRKLFKRPLPARWRLVALFLAACPVLMATMVQSQEERIALSVAQLAQPIARFKLENGRFPETLREVNEFSTGPDFVSDRSLRVHGRMVSYRCWPRCVATGSDDTVAYLSYWSFGFYQTQIFNVGRGAFDAPLVD